jgi:hypothetical protein
MIDWLFTVLRLKNISLIWRRHHCRWRAAKYRPMLGVQGRRAGRDLYRATPAVTWDLGFSGLIRSTAPFSCLWRQKKGCGGSILTRILTGPDIVHARLSCISLIHIFLSRYIFFSETIVLCLKVYFGFQTLFCTSPQTSDMNRRIETDLKMKNARLASPYLTRKRKH